MSCAEQQPDFISPMLLSPGPIPQGGNWSLEIKWDGMRGQLRFDGGKLTVRSRPGRDCTAQFPELTGLADALCSRRVILDGELVCLRPDGRPDFAALRQRINGRSRRPAPVTYIIFDLLHLDGRCTRELPYADRRALLAELDLDGNSWRTPMTVRAEHAEEFLAQVAALGLEGVVAKRSDSRYRPGQRSKAWIKHKLRRNERLAVTGLRRSPNGKVQALLVARLGSDGDWRRAGSIEIGLYRPLLDDLERQLSGTPSHTRGSTTFYPDARVFVTASVHGLEDGPVRDAVLRAVH